MAQDIETLRKRLQKTMEKPSLATGGFGAAGSTVQPKATSDIGGFDYAVTGYKRQNSNVSDVAADMMSEDNRAMQLAKTRGTQQANARGVLNSSIAAGAAQDEMMKYVTPMAQQEASQRHAENLSDQGYRQSLSQAEQGFGFASALTDKESEIRMKEAEQAFGFQTKLSDQEFQQALQLSDQEFEHQTGMSKLEFAQNRKLQEDQIQAEERLAKLDANTRTQLMEMESSLKKRLAKMEIAADDSTQMSNMVSTMFDQYQKSMNSILANPNLPADERTALLESAGALIGRQVDMTETMFNIDIDWPTSTFNPNTGKTKKQEKKAAKKAEKNEKNNDTSSPTGPTTADDYFYDGAGNMIYKGP